MGNIKDFTDLVAWQEAHKLVLMIYKATKRFPREELYRLTSQICDAAVSITSNLAEGFSRFHYKDKLNFYYNSRGSIAEVINQLIIARDLGYVTFIDYEMVEVQANKTSAILRGLISKTKDYSNNK